MQNTLPYLMQLGKQYLDQNRRELWKSGIE
jgi:hypothetical protein